MAKASVGGLEIQRHRRLSVPWSVRHTQTSKGRCEGKRLVRFSDPGAGGGGPQHGPDDGPARDVLQIDETSLTSCPLVADNGERETSGRNQPSRRAANRAANPLNS